MKIIITGIITGIIYALAVINTNADLLSKLTYIFILYPLVFCSYYFVIKNIKKIIDTYLEIKYIRTILFWVFLTVPIGIFIHLPLFLFKIFMEKDAILYAHFLLLALYVPLHFCLIAFSLIYDIKDIMDYFKTKR